jgi:inosose dehydratase
LFDGLDSRYVGFAPDTGHIARGGMDVVELFETYRSLIKHIHFKDIAAGGGASDGGAAGGEWTAMGAGTIDFPRIVTRLRDTGYTGWIMVEEESFEAETDPDAAAGKNGIYLRQSLLPIVSGD